MLIKRIAPLLLALAICFSLTAPAMAAESSDAAAKADALRSLGLFKGTDAGYELERAPTRTEALVMLIRVLGKDSAAKSYSGALPFTDVPSWARGYVSYGFEKGLTKGVSETEFGAGDTASSAMYLTFMLRALGYSDAEGDFTWSEPYTLSDNLGLLMGGIDTKSFLRADVAVVSYNALSCLMKDGAGALSRKLIKEGVFTSAQLIAAHELAGSGSAPADETAQAESLLSSVGSWSLDQYPGAQFVFNADKSGSFTVGGSTRLMSWDLGSFERDGFSGLKVSFADGSVVEYPEFALGSCCFVVSQYGEYMGTESYLYRPSVSSSGVSFPVSALEGALAGVWKQKDGEEVYTLNADGTGTHSLISSESAPLKWAAFGGNTLYIYLPEALDENGQITPYAYTVYVTCSGSELSIFSDGQATVYVRQQITL